MKKTAVEWLEEQINYISIEELKTQIIIAKEMEKKQIIDAFNVGFNVGINDELSPSYLEADEYYNEKFKP